MVTECFTKRREYHSLRLKMSIMQSVFELKLHKKRAELLALEDEVLAVKEEVQKMEDKEGGPN